MGHVYAVVPHSLYFLFRRPHTVGHDGFHAAAEHAEMVVCIAVKLRPRAKFLHPVNLSLVFRQMGLDRKIILHLNLLELFHQGVGAGGNEPWRENGSRVPVPSLYVLQPLSGLPQGFRCLLHQDIRAVPVHVDLAYHGLKSGLLHQIHEKLRSLPVHGCKYTSPCGCTVFHVFRKYGIRLPGILHIAVLGLLWKRPRVQPFQ